MRFRNRLWGIVAFATAGLVGGPLLIGQDQEWEESSPYYEDDAWYDVSEWFDSNDYNPTDEEFGVIDDEEYDYGRDDADFDNDYDYDFDYGSDYGYDDDLVGYDYDDDYYDSYDDDWTWYGYDDYGEDDWFYDWYDDGYATWYDWDDDGLYDSKYRYYDYDDDGLYDALLTQYDYDDDGRYDESDFDFFSNDVSSAQEEESRQGTDEQSRSRQISGTVRRVKTVSLTDSENLVVELEPQSGERVKVDLGPRRRIEDLDIQSGNRLQVSGPMTRIGEEHVVLAKTFTFNDRQRTVNRETRQTQGTVASTREVRTRGGRHLLAMLKQNGDKLAVDLGSADGDLNVQDGDRLTVFGPRVKVNDRTILMAQKIRRNGNTQEIRRMSSQDRAQASSRRDGDDRSRSQDTSRRAGRQDRDSGRTQQDRGVARVAGEISALRRVTVRDSRRQIAEVDTQRGKVVIDLGPANRFDADLQEGDRIEAEGAMTRSGETPVLIARNITANDQTFRIGSGREDGRRRRDRQEASGEIMRLRNVTVRDERRRLATLETDEGRRISVDLGRRDRLDADLSEGDTITVDGVLVRNGDRSTLVATSVTLDGRTRQVSRPFLGDEEQQDQSRQDQNESRRNRQDQEDQQ